MKHAPSICLSTGQVAAAMAGSTYMPSFGWIQRKPYPTKQTLRVVGLQFGVGVWNSRRSC